MSSQLLQGETPAPAPCRVRTTLLVGSSSHLMLWRESCWPVALSVCQEVTVGCSCVCWGSDVPLLLTHSVHLEGGAGG